MVTYEVDDNHYYINVYLYKVLDIDCSYELEEVCHEKMEDNDEPIKVFDLDNKIKSKKDVLKI